jgi:hypothetical protein
LILDDTVNNKKIKNRSSSNSINSKVMELTSMSAFVQPLIV